MNTVDDPAATYKLLARGLEEIGYGVELQDAPDGKEAIFSAPDRQPWLTKISHIHYPFTQPSVRELSIDKAKAYEYATTKNVPVPYTHSLAIDDEFEHARATTLLETHEKLIVKPNNSSLSKGLTLNITNTDKLHKAIAHARDVKSHDVLIQEQVDGEEIRFIVMKGEVKAALLRQSARVVGDGRSTVAELLKKENQTRQTLVFPYIHYPQLDETMIDPTYFKDQTVLEEGKVLRLNRATMIRNGCSVYNVLDTVHPSYIDAVERLATDVETDFMAVDFLLKDYTAQATENNFWFLEFNTSPVLKLCYGCRDGNMFDVVPLLAALIDDTLKA